LQPSELALASTSAAAATYPRVRLVLMPEV